MKVSYVALFSSRMSVVCLTSWFGFVVSRTEILCIAALLGCVHSSASQFCRVVLPHLPLVELL